MGAEQPALQQRDRPVTGLRGVGLALLGFGLSYGLVWARAKACLVLADMTIRGDGGIRGTLIRLLRKLYGRTPSLNFSQA